MRDISALVRARAREISISFKELVASKDFFAYLSGTAQSMLSGVISPTIKLLPSDASAVGYTDGSTISINPAPALLNGLPMFQKVQGVLGILYHEISHILYSDFSEVKNLYQQLAKGQFPVCPPHGDKDAIDNIQKAIATPYYAPFFTQLYSELDNYIADQHDENALIKAYSGSDEKRVSVVEKCIIMVRNQLFKTASPIDELFKDDSLQLTLMLSIIFQYVRFGNLMLNNPELETQVEHFDELKLLCDKAVSTDVLAIRYNYINQIVVFLWPYIQKNLPPFPQNQNQNQNSGNNGNPSNQQANDRSSCEHSGNSDNSGNPNPQITASDNTSDQSSGNQENASNDREGESNRQSVSVSIDDLLNALNQAIQNTPSTKAPINTQSSKIAKQRSKQEQIADTSKNSEPSEPSVSQGNNRSSERADASLQNSISTLLEALANQKAENDVARQLDEGTKTDLSKVVLGSCHKGQTLVPKTAKPVSHHNITEYQSVMREVRTYSQRLQRLLKQEIEIAQRNSVVRHRAFGRTLDTRDAYRADSKYWTNKKTPSDIPEMVVSVLLDNSGSTADDGRINAEKKAAVLLQDFCQGLNIPCMVAGFFTYSNKTDFTVYSNFDEVSPSHRPKIMQMEPFGCNRDGLALRASMQLLDQRPEPVRLQFIISDGLPNAQNYRTKEAKADVAELRKWGKHRNIEIIAAAIGDDKPKIQEIYGDSFVDISRLDTLPKTIVKIVKKRIQNLL